MIFTVEVYKHRYLREFKCRFYITVYASHQDVLDALAAGKIDKDITAAIEETAAVVVASMKQ